ncbi:MAG: AAA-like domain-containing protein [Methylococcales bacterium]
MSEAIPEPFTENGFFQAGGTLKANVLSYIERPADRELYQSLLAGDYCYILTPRQMGKSSLMTRIAARLRDQGLRVAVVDLTGIGGDAGSITADQWYYSLAHSLLRELQIGFSLAKWWKDQSLLSPLHRLMNFFEEGVLGQVEGRIVVFVDEIDTTIKLPFSDDFFAAIRAGFNARANDNRFSRLSFILLGVASPAELIRDPTRTPFNIGKRIDLADFNDREARLFLQGLIEQGENAETRKTI